MDECRRVLDILKDYEEASGQKMNKTKTALFFSKAIDAAIKNNIKDAWGVQEIMQWVVWVLEILLCSMTHS